MIRMLFVGLPVVAWFVLAAGGSAAVHAKELTAKGVEYFEKQIRPVLVQRCYSCHSSSVKEPKGGLVLDTRAGLRKGGESGAVIVPGNIEESLLIQAIKFEGLEMPPGNKLPDDVIHAFEKWVEMGAPDPRTGKPEASRKVNVAEARNFWSFKKPVKPQVPNVRDTSWPINDIDRFVLAKLEAKNMHPVADANRATLLRRLCYDLTGLPPTADQVIKFAGNGSQISFPAVVDHFLDSPHFGERWGRHWLDVARYGESTGKERNIAYPYAWRYRDYVIDSFNKDKPYDRFVREQIAGDLLPFKSAAERNENVIATGFLAIGTKSLNEKNREQYLLDVADEQIDVATRAVLGMTVACARCHDHKFDPISAADYYAVAGIFRSTEVLAGVRPGNNKTGYDGQYMKLSEGNGYSAEQKKEMAKLADEMKADRDKLAQTTAALRFSGLKKDKKEKLKSEQDRLESRIKKHDKDMKAIRDNPGAGDEPVMAVHDSNKPANVQIRIRGEVKELGPEVPRGIPVVLATDRISKFETPQSGRQQLAAWMTSRDNPLTARVEVNRIWAHLFGKGIVESTDNFGSLGDDPTHPELLDYLAIRFMEQGWSVKKMIREIMLSRVYQLGSDHHAANYAVDADNHLLWRVNRRRLEAEAIRDSILSVSGLLDTNRPEGSLAKKFAGEEVGRGKAAAPKQNDVKCRSVYLTIFRNSVPDILGVFDMADPSLIVPQREVTTVATQALFMMNSPFVAENTNATAKKLLAESGLKDTDRVIRLFLMTLNRPPTTSERTRSLAYLQEYEQLLDGKETPPLEKRVSAWASLCQTLMASGEFRYVY